MIWFCRYAFLGVLSLFIVILFCCISLLVILPSTFGVSWYPGFIFLTFYLFIFSHCLLLNLNICQTFFFFPEFWVLFSHFCPDLLFFFIFIIPVFLDFDSSPRSFFLAWGLDMQGISHPSFLRVPGGRLLQLLQIFYCVSFALTCHLSWAKLPLDFHRSFHLGLLWSSKIHWLFEGSSVLRTFSCPPVLSSSS